MSQKLRRLAAVISAAGLSAGAVAAATPVPASAGETGSPHVLLLSVDGLHQADLDWYVEHHPASALARLTHRGVDFTHAQTTVPSDSFPGMLAQVTGGSPASTGIYYDDSYNHALLPAGTTTCTPGQPTGAEVAYTEAADKNMNSIDAGQGLTGLPENILQMTGSPWPTDNAELNSQ